MLVNTLTKWTLL